VAASIITATLSLAQTAEDKEKTLHDAQNPIATTIGVPFQSNMYFRRGTRSS